MINTNTRFLRYKEGAYCMSNLCDSCGHNQTCSIRSQANMICTDYQPVLAFKSMAGTENRFNTFRLGGAWTKRLQPGQRIGLIDAKLNKTGEALVTDVHCGDKLLMLEIHAARNHLMIAKPHQDPAIELARLLRNLYGTGFFAKAGFLTVIDLERL